MGILIYFADYLARNRNNLYLFKVGILNIGLVIGLVGLLLLMQPDFGNNRGGRDNRGRDDVSGRGSSQSFCDHHQYRGSADDADRMDGTLSSGEADQLS